MISPIPPNTFFISWDDDINISNEEVFEIYKKGNKINLFDIYRMDIIGGYNNNGSSE